MSSIQGVSPNTVNWQSLLDKLVETSGVEGAAKISADNRSLVFTASVNGVESQITVRIPDDLELPGEVDETAIASLVEKLKDPVFNLTADQIKAFEGEITQIYNDMASAVAETGSKSTGSVLFDLYQLMALLVEVAQSQRDAARDLRTAQSAQIQNSIQAQADTQRSAAMVGLIVGVVCGALNALCSIGMLAMQGASYKKQLNAARSSGADAAQTNANMIKSADTAAHAQAQLQKVQGQVGEPTATKVPARINSDVQAKREAFTEAKAEVGRKQNDLQTKQQELDTATAARTAKQNDLATAQQANSAARLEAEIPGGKTAAEAKADYLQQCESTHAEPDAQKVAKMDAAIQAEQNMSAAQTALAAAPSEEAIATKQAAVTDARTALDKAETTLDTARGEYRASLKSSADAYTAKYEASVAADGPNSEAAKTTRNEMRMAQAYANSQLAEDGVTTAAEHHDDLVAANAAADLASQRLNANADFRHSLHRIEVFAGINAINTSIGNMLQSMTQNISGMINAEATREGAEQQEQQDQLDQTKDLFEQAQGLVDSVVQLMQAIAAAESQSMHEAIQA